ncbi:MAG: type IIL restriction-modification enzyme MmeI [Sphingomonadales bacterium]
MLDARAAYPTSSLADLYDPDTMPPNLRKAHAAIDMAVSVQPSNRIGRLNPSLPEIPARLRLVRDHCFVPPCVRLFRWQAEALSPTLAELIMPHCPKSHPTDRFCFFSSTVMIV